MQEINLMLNHCFQKVKKTFFFFFDLEADFFFQDTPFLGNRLCSADCIVRKSAPSMDVDRLKFAVSPEKLPVIVNAVVNTPTRAPTISDLQLRQGFTCISATPLMYIETRYKEVVSNWFKARRFFVPSSSPYVLFEASHTVSVSDLALCLTNVGVNFVYLYIIAHKDSHVDKALSLLDHVCIIFIYFFFYLLLTLYLLHCIGSYYDKTWVWYCLDHETWSICSW